MLDLRSTSRVLGKYHDRFQDDMLPKELSLQAFAAFDRGAYDAASLDWGLGAWQARLLDEYRSQVAFSDMLLQLTELGFSFDILGTAIRVVRDEARHVELCRRMIHALGGDDIIPGDPAYVNPDKSLAPMLRVLQTTVGFLCIGETISLRLILGVRNMTIDPLARRLITCLAADESLHSSFGWNLLEVLTPVLSADERAWVNESLSPFFGAVKDIVRASAGSEVSEAAEPLSSAPPNPFGYLSARDRMDVFDEAMRRDILPRFETLGFAARSAWNG
jgi:hypothetical protein